MKYRRVVTNVNSQIEQDEILDLAVEYEDGHKLTEIWTTNSPLPNLEDDYSKKDFSLRLKPGHSRFVTCTIPPFSSVQSYEVTNRAHISTKKYGMHSTQTIDYVIVFEGEVELHVGNEIVSLKRGDTIVQRGAIHAWQNKSDKPAEIIAVMLGASECSKFIQNDFQQIEKQLT